METIATLIGGIISGVVITIKGIPKGEISSIGTTRTTRTIRATKGTAEISEDSKITTNQITTINHYKSTIWMKINGW